MTLHSTEPFIPAQPSGAPNLPAIIDQLPANSAHPAQTQFTRTRQAAFLRRLADSGEVRVAARASNISHQTVYRMRRACRTFRRGWDAALLVARERAEEVLATRALHGVEEQVFYHGEVVATRRRYDSRLLLAHLARLDRLASQKDVAVLAGSFDDVLAALETAEEGEEPTLPVAPADTGPETPSGPCNMRSMSSDEPDADPEVEESEPALEQRLAAMEAARPAGALLPHQLANAERDSGEVEWAQLLAFEAGEERWWEAGAATRGRESEGAAEWL
ncbi:MAG: hypothetical protein QNJ15_14960 [Erythrobacter sp.]|nr:hypothetical protein [Erythrobacter sp.]